MHGSKKLIKSLIKKLKSLLSSSIHKLLFHWIFNTKAKYRVFFYQKEKCQSFPLIFFIFIFHLKWIHVRVCFIEREALRLMYENIFNYSSTHQSWYGKMFFNTLFECARNRKRQRKLTSFTFSFQKFCVVVWLICFAEWWWSCLL